MSAFDHLISGFGVVLTWKTLFYCFIGCLWGTVVGVLPGLGPLAGMVLLLPLTFTLDPTSGIVMLAGIFYGAMYGGSTTSILVRIPGEAASVITCLDGYEMARQGRAGPALVIAAVGSFVGGTVSVLGLMLVAPPLARVMVAIGPSVEVVLMLMALCIITLVSGGSRLKTAAMIMLGLVMGTVGIDKLTGVPRFTFGNLGLADGLTFTALAIGLFGISEILLNLEKSETIKAIRPKLKDLVPRWSDLKESAPAIGRGTIIGFIFGIIPGVSHVVSTFVSYAVEKRFSKHPERFGKGAIAGVAGPETANNATTGTAMIPLLALGIPSIPATAILLSALTIHGVQPGPLLMSDNPQVFWGLVASMYVGNAVLLLLNLPFVGVFVNCAFPTAGSYRSSSSSRSSASIASTSNQPTSGSWFCRVARAICCVSSVTKWRRCCSRSCWATGWRRTSVSPSQCRAAPTRPLPTRPRSSSSPPSPGCCCSCRPVPGPSATARPSPTRRSEPRHPSFSY
jgi:putative tricarboxylic transport membrane protein